MSKIETIKWQSPGAPPLLDEHPIHVWRIRLKDIHLINAEVLSREEHSRLQRIQDTHQKDNYLKTRYLLRRLLADYTNSTPQSLRIGKSQKGKPYLKDQEEPEISFNLSHCRDLMLIAVANNPVGVDIEQLRPVSNCLAIAERVLPDEDVREITAATAVEREEVFFSKWTAFEARQKACGQGVFDDKVESGYRQISFRPDTDHLAALACCGRSIDQAPLFLDAGPYLKSL